MDFSDGELGDQGAYRASNGSDGASTGGDTMPTAGQLTVRQRAKEYGEPVTELQSLPMGEPYSASLTPDLIDQNSC